MLLQLGDAMPGFGLRKITQKVTSPGPSSSSSGSSTASSWSSSSGNSQLPHAYAEGAPGTPDLGPNLPNTSSGNSSSGSPGVLKRLAADKLQQAHAHATAAAQQAVAVAGDITNALLPPGEAPAVPPGAAARVVNKAVFGLGLLGVWGLELSGWWVQAGKDNWSSQVRAPEVVWQHLRTRLQCSAADAQGSSKLSVRHATA